MENDHIFNLPNDINGWLNNDDGIFFHHYNQAPNTFKGKSILHTNAISLVIEGTKTIHFANKKVTIREGEFHFLSMGNCLVTMDLPKDKQFESVLIFFENKVLADFHLKYQHKINTLKKADKITAEPYLEFKKDEFIENYIQSLKLFLCDSTAMPSEMRVVKFEELMLYLLNKYPLQLLSFPLSKNRDLEDMEIQKAVEINVTNNISLSELAFLCNLSLSTFKRRFEKIYGTAPGKWFLHKKMELAKNLIVENGERPGEIYHKVGYENHSSFSQSFKQHFGIVPSALKQVN